jgi:hypothetical protein
MTKSRSRLHELSAAAYANGNYTGWFETLYVEAQGNSEAIPWADRGANPWLLDWINRSELSVQNLRVLVVGCGGSPR